MRITPETTRADFRRKEPRRQVDRLVSEQNFQVAIVEAAKLSGWAVWHDTDSRRNLAGLPDLELVRDRLVKAELKRQTGNPTPGQERYLLALARAGVETYLWRPSDWHEIVGVLKRGGDR